MASIDRPIDFGSYRLLERIRVGGMAEIWRARRVLPTGATQLVALKRALPTVAEDPELAALFGREAELTLSLDHPNIVRALEAGRVGARPFLALELLAGPDLRDLIGEARHAGTPIPAGLACHVVAGLCRALDYLHARGLAHGDVSPENGVLALDGTPKLLDFGIARPAERAGDLFAAALLLVELASGARPGNPIRVPPLEPAALGAIAARALAPDPSGRFPSAAVFADALEELVRARPFGRREAARFVRTLLAHRFERDRVFQGQAAAVDRLGGR